MALMRRFRAVTTGVGGSPYFTTIYFGGATDNLFDVAQVFRGILTGMAALQTNLPDTIPDGIAVVMDENTGQPVGNEAYAAGAIIKGNSASPEFPLQVQAGVAVRTNVYRNGRRIQGHLNIGAVGSSNGSPAGPFLEGVKFTALQTALNNAIAAPEANWVVWSRGDGTNGTYAPVTQAALRGTWFTLRSRLT